MQICISLAPRRIVRILAFIAISLVIISLVTGMGVYFFQPQDRAVRALFTFTNVDNENSISTYFSLLLLITIALLSLLIARIKQLTDPQSVLRWYLLAAGFLYLSADEVLSIHEFIGNLIRNSNQTTGYLTHAWVIPAVPIVIAFFVVYGRLLMALPPPVRNILFAGLALYTFGTIILEMLGGHFQSVSGRDAPIVRGLQHVEELGEMMGAILVIYGLLSYLNISIQFPVVIHLRRAESYAPVVTSRSATQNE